MRRFVCFVASVLVAVGLVAAPPGAAPAQALSSGLHFTADDLPTWQTNGTVWALAQSGGTVYAGGTFSQIRPPDGSAGSPQAQASFASFDAATGTPGTCRPNVTGSAGTVRALATSPDGSTLFIGGSFTSVGSVAVARLAALDVASCTVTPFRTPLINGLVRGLAVTSTTVYVAGEFQTVGSSTRQHFAAFNSTTGALLPWTANADDWGKAIAVSADGSLVALGGNFFSVNGQASHSIAIVNPSTGANIRNYPAPFIPNASTTQTIASDATGFYFGNEGTGGGVFDGKLAIDYSTLNQRWRNTCEGATQALAIEGGTLYSAHHHHNCLAMGWFQDGTRVYLSAERTSDTQMLAWRPSLNDGLEEGIGGRALTIAPAGGQKYLWVGGMFTQTNGKAQQGLTRFGQTPDTGNPPVPTNVSTESLITGQVKVRWRTVLDPDDGLLTYRVYRNGTLIGQVQAQSRWWHRPQASFTDTTAVPGATYSYRVSASDGPNTSAQSGAVDGAAVAASAPYASKVVADGATSYWRFDEASGEYGTDSSLGDRNPRYTRDPDYRASSNAVAGEPGYAMRFGSLAYAFSDSWAPAPAVYTLEAWFKTSTSEGGKLLGYGNQLPTSHNPVRHPISSNYDRHVYMRDDGRLAFGVYTGSTQVLTTSQAYNDATWHHVVATQGPGGMRLYVDGVQVGSNSITGNQAYTGSLRVGGDNLAGWPSRPSSYWFDGLIDEVAAYPSALTAGQVSAHYQAGTGGGTPDTTPPSAPTSLAATASGTSVNLSWTASTDNVGVAGYAVHRSPVNGFTPSAATAIAFVNSTAYTDPGPGGGTWYYRVLATDAAGNSSGPSNQASTTVDGGANPVTVTIAPTDDAFVRSDTPTSNYNGVNQLWNRAPTPELISYLKFSLPPAAAGTTLTSARLRLRTTTAATSGSTGVFNVSSATGSWTESAVTYANRPTPGTVLGQVPADTLSNTEYEIALNPVALAAQLGGPTTLAISGVPGALDSLGVWSKEFGVASYQPALVLELVPTGSIDTTPPSSPTGLAATTSGTSIDLSWTASTDNVAVTGYQVHRSAAAGFTPNAGTQIATSTGAAYTDPGPGTGTWYYRVIATDAAGNSSTPSGAAAATVPPPPDTTPPSTPQGLTAAAAGLGANLAWTASTDNVAVTGYEVHRSATDGFAPGPSTQVANPTGTAYADVGVGVGTWYYRVIAVDAEGNASPASTQASATIAEPGGTVTQTLAPTDDAFVRSDTPTTNYNGINQLFGRAPTPELVSYLGFSLPPAPAGTTLVGARLRVRTTTSAASGSAGTFDIALATGAWTETAVTFATRPTVTSALGQLPGGSLPNTEYTIALNPSTLTAQLGQPTTLALSGAPGAQDSLGIWSKEFVVSSYQPALILDFAPTP